MKSEPRPSDFGRHNAPMGALFGVLIACGLALWFLNLYPKPWHIKPTDIESYMPRVAMLGALFGWVLRHRADGQRIYLAIFFGPITVHMLPFVTSVVEQPFSLIGLPLTVLFLSPWAAVIAFPFSLPTALISSRYNDPELARPKRQLGWLVFALLLSVTGAVGVHHRWFNALTP